MLLMKTHLNIALVGNPNCGKTALFNALTGSKQKVANYAGVTVEKKHGYFVTPENIQCTLIDLLGLTVYAPEALMSRSQEMLFKSF